MEINRDNYEAYFLDAIEGNVTPEIAEKLLAFVAANPDLRDAFDTHAFVTLPTEKNVFDNKQLLKKDIAYTNEITNNNFDTYCIARIEGDLSPTQTAAFDAYLVRNPQKLIDYTLFLKTILEPDKNITYPHKNALRQHVIKPYRRTTMFAVAAAASVASIMFTYYAWQQFNPTQHTRVATIKTSVTSTASIYVQAAAHKAVATHINSLPKNDKAAPSTMPYIIESEIDTTNILGQLQSKSLENMPQPTADNALRTTLAQGYAYVPKNEAITDEANYLSVEEYAKKELAMALEMSKANLHEGNGLWTLAKAGLQRFNKIAGTHLTLTKDKNKEGDRTIIAFHSKLLGYYSSSEK